MPKVDLAIGDEKVWEESVSQSVGLCGPVRMQQLYSAKRFLVTEEDLGPKGIRINGQNFIIHVLHLFCLAVAVNDNQYFLHTHRA